MMVYTYFIQEQDNPAGPIKIGRTTGDPILRLASIQGSSPVVLRMLGCVPQDIERALHAMLDADRLHGEWFRPSPELLAFIGELPAQKKTVLPRGKAKPVSGATRGRPRKHGATEFF